MKNISKNLSLGAHHEKVIEPIKYKSWERERERERELKKGNK